MQKTKELTVAEAARKLGIRIDYLTLLLRSGKIGARKWDGRWLIPAATVEARVEGREPEQAT